MRYGTFLWFAVALSLSAFGGETSDESMTSSLARSAQDARPTGRFLRNANPVRDQYIVVLNQDAEARDIQDVAQELAGRYRGQLHRTFRHALRGFVVKMPEVDAQALAQQPIVAYVEEDGWVHPDAIQTGATWGIDRVDQRSLPLNGTYQYNTMGSGVHAYVIDTGIRASHSEFGGRVSLDWTAVHDGNGASDCNGHGTHVAGTIGGRTWGVAKNVRLHSVRVFDCSGNTNLSTVIAAVDWVTAKHIKPAVVNMSLGGGAAQSLDDAVTNSVAAGVVYTVSAGSSSGADACGFSPARAPAAITVGSTDNNDSRSSFSNIGKCMDLFAPGRGITSAWWSSDTATSTSNGTSMAAPHVAGAAALFLGSNPTATPAQVTSALIDNSTKGRVANAGPDSPNRLLYTGSTICTGQTVAGATNWQQYGADGLFLYVDTSSCGFSSTPLYFTSIGGWGGHWGTKGATSIYWPSATGFGVFIYFPGITPAAANQAGWHINWQATPNNLRKKEACTGQTVAGATNWQQYGTDGIYLVVDTSSCGFLSTPLYFTSIGGWGGHWATTGATSIYWPSANGFVVFINSPGITPAAANQAGWHINWQATPNNLRKADACTGQTVAGATNWQQYGTTGIFILVDTSSCGLPSTPLHFTSIGGWGGHWGTVGATSIYWPSADGFVVFIHFPPGITPAVANQAGWHINWSLR